MKSSHDLSRSFGGEKVCAVIAERTASAAIRRTSKAASKARLLEIRLDHFVSRRETLRFLEWLRRKRRAHKSRVGRATVIATCRRRKAGGRFAGSVAAQLEWIRLAARCGCQWVDVERETASLFPSREVREWIRPAKWIVSAHDFSRRRRKNRIPARRVLGSLKKASANVSKIALNTITLRESLDLAALGKGIGILAIPMGQAGFPVRMLALRERGAFLYAAAGERTAPGQPSLREALDVYRANKIGPKTDVYGVVGNPIAQSLSPDMHNAAFRDLGMNAVLLPFWAADASDFARCIKRIGLQGFAVTLPYKEKMMRYLDECEAAAAEAGAVNTVAVQRNGGLTGYNTDCTAFLRTLEGRMEIPGKRALVIGAGGFARAAVRMLVHAGAEVHIHARCLTQAQRLARRFGAATLPRSALRRENFDVIVNATPLGMYPDIHESPLRADELRCELVFDAIYRPIQTRLLKIAESLGIRCVPGVEMFIAQGAAQFEIWTGKKAPEKAMRRAVMAALEPRDGLSNPT